MRSCWSRTGQRENILQRQKRIHREEDHAEMETEISVMLPKARDTRSHQELKRPGWILSEKL